MLVKAATGDKHSLNFVVACGGLVTIDFTPIFQGYFTGTSANEVTLRDMVKKNHMKPISTAI